MDKINPIISGCYDRTFYIRYYKLDLFIKSIQFKIFYKKLIFKEQSSEEKEVMKIHFYPSVSVCYIRKELR